MSMQAEADKPAVYRKLRTEDWLVRSYEGGYPYLKDGVLLRSSPNNPIYSYGRNYTKYKNEFSLFVWTTEKDQSKIAELFDRALKRVRVDDVKSVLNGTKSFHYVEVDK